MKTLVILATFTLSAFAQGGAVPMSWTASVTPGASYNMWRAPGPCTPTPANFVKINAVPITGTAYTDQNVPLGLWCYRSTAFVGTLESVPSNLYGATVNPEPPTGLQSGIQVTVNVTVNGVTQQETKTPVK